MKNATEFAKSYRRAHNRASRLYKAAFKAAGARMWSRDDCHSLSKENEAFIAQALAKGIPQSVYRVAPRPLTVCDNYPQANRKQLDREVDKIWRRHQQEVEAL